MALTRVASGTERDVSVICQWSKYHRLTCGKNMSKKLINGIIIIREQISKAYMIRTLYDCSPCLCLASPSNPYVRFMSFAS